MIYLYNKFYENSLDDEAEQMEHKLRNKTNIILFNEHGDRTFDIAEAQIAYLTNKEACDLFIEAHNISDCACEGDWCIGLNYYSPKSGLWIHIPDICMDALKAYFTKDCDR